MYFYIGFIASSITFVGIVYDLFTKKITGRKDRVGKFFNAVVYCLAALFMLEQAVHAIEKIMATR